MILIVARRIVPSDGRIKNQFQQKIPLEIAWFIRTGMIGNCSDGAMRRVTTIKNARGGSFGGTQPRAFSLVVMVYRLASKALHRASAMTWWPMAEGCTPSSSQ